MHAALNITEIQCLIIDNLIDQNSHSEPRIKEGHESLLSLALTSKALFPASTDALWRRLVTLKPLMKTFPKDLWHTQTVEEYETDDDDSQSEALQEDQGQPQLILLRDIRQSDWDRFDIYASKVRQLEFTRYPARHLGSPMPEITPDAFTKMDISRPACSWFPKLENLWLVGLASENTCYAGHLLNDSVKSLRITGTILLGQGYNGSAIKRQSQAAKDILDKAVLTATDLRELHISCYERCHTDNLAQLVKRRPLISFQAGDTFLDKAILLELIAKSSVKTLDCKISSNLLASMRGPGINCSTFINLKHLRLHVPKLAVAGNFVNATSSTLQTVNIVTARQSSTKGLIIFLKALISHRSDLREVTVDCKEVSRFDEDHVWGFDLSSEEESDASICLYQIHEVRAYLCELLRSRKLRTLRLLKLHSTLFDGIERSFLENLAESVPRARDITLQGSDQKTLDMGDVAHFCSKLPFLEKLAISGVDATRIPDDIDAPESVQLSRVTLIWAPISNPPDVAGYLRKNFPRLGNVDNGQQITAEWQEVRKVIHSEEPHMFGRYFFAGTRFEVECVD